MRSDRLQDFEADQIIKLIKRQPCNLESEMIVEAAGCRSRLPFQMELSVCCNYSLLKKGENDEGNFAMSVAFFISDPGVPTWLSDCQPVLQDSFSSKESAL